MAGLLDTIKKQLSTPGAAPQLGETEQARGLLRAKLGKAGGPETVPAQSNIGEQVAQQQTQLGLRDIASKGQIAGAQLGEQQADIEQRSAQQDSEQKQQMQQLQSGYAKQAQSILDELGAQAAGMDVNRRMAKMEQAGFAARLSNDQYLNKLQQQGKLQRLDDDRNFKYAAAEDIFADQQDLLKDDLRFKAMMDAGDREFNEALSQMSDDFALKMADKALQDQAAAAKYSAMAGLGGAGVNAFLANQGGSTGDDNGNV